MWMLGDIGHCSTDMSSLRTEGSLRQAKVLFSLAKGGMDEVQSPEGTPNPKIPVAYRSHCPLEFSLPCRPSSRLLPTPSQCPALPFPIPHHRLSPIISFCPEAIDSSHSISIDLFLSPPGSFSFYQWVHQICLFPLHRLLYTDKFPSPVRIHGLHNK